MGLSLLMSATDRKYFKLCDSFVRQSRKKKRKKEVVLQRVEFNKLIALMKPSRFETAPPKAKDRI